MFLQKDSKNVFSDRDKKSKLPGTNYCSFNHLSFLEKHRAVQGGLVFQLVGSETLIFCADNDNICEKWMAAINKHAVNNAS